jgi:hypothetical protein
VSEDEMRKNKTIDVIHNENITELKQRGRGQNYAFILTILFLGTSVFAGFNGLETLSVVLGGATITNVVAAFLKKGNNNKNTDS